MVSRLSRLEAFLKSWGLAVGLLAIHAALALNAAQRLSPVWDEIIYPAAGVSYWSSGKLLLNPEHPPLSKLLLSAPLLALHPKPPEIGSNTPPDAFRLGFQFIYNNTVPAQRLIFWSRVPAVLFSILTGLLIFIWMRSLWGPVGGAISLFVYATTPVFLSRASLALLEMPMYFFILLSLFLYAQRDRGSQRSLMMRSGVALGCALACKLIAIALVPTYILLACVQGKNVAFPDRERRQHLAILFASALATLVLLYLPWAGSWSAFKEVFGNLSGYSSRLPYYFHGEWLTRATPLVGWIAIGLKAPLALMILGAWGAWDWKKTGRHFFIWSLAVAFIGVTLGMISLRYAVSTVQTSALYLAVAMLAAALAVQWNSTRTWPRCAIIGLALWGSWDVAQTHPNYVGYFNALAGGTDNGYRWLSDSDQDWGQSLPALAEYQRRQGEPHLLLAYSGSGDPRAYGLMFQDLFSPALYIRETQGELIPNDGKPIWVALSAKVLQTEPEAMRWLPEHVASRGTIGATFLIYDITHNVDAYRWLAEIYTQTRRPVQAKWALERARLEKTS